MRDKVVSVLESCFFFFQAEDGIRDKLVTGVQTCALPISLERLSPEPARLLQPHLDRLRRRSDYRAGAPWQLFRTTLAFAPHRVLWPDLAQIGRASCRERV